MKKFIALGLLLLSTAAIAGPLDKTEITILKNRHKGVKSELKLSCTEREVQLKDCQYFQFTHSPKLYTHSGTNLVGTTADLRGALNSLVKEYDNEAHWELLINGTLTGVVIGAFSESLPAAIGLGILGAVVDVAKAPVTIPYTVTQKIHRSAQKSAMKRRFKRLLKNKRFKATRVLNRNNYRGMIYGLGYSLND